MLQLLKESVQKSDFAIWLATIWFFLVSALLSNWNLQNSLFWAFWIIWLMFLVWLSIELILSALKNIKWLWEVTGFITNWPEALVLIVWLISGNILFAAWTPLGSNLMNPILLLLAVIATSSFVLIKNFKYKFFYLLGFAITAFFGIWIYKFLEIEKYEKYFLPVALFATIVCIFLYFKNKKIMQKEEKTDEEEVSEKAPKYFLPLWIVLLLWAWYFLDPVVNFTATASNAPAWLISFLVLSTLTSWPEFKSCVSLLRKGKTLDAFVNILISNFTNIWLATVWILVYVFTK